MKKVDFTNFTVTTNSDEKHFFEEGLIHNEMEMLSIVDARKHFEQRYNDDPFFETEPKDITYILGLYQKLELFSIERISFERLYNSIASHSHGENQPVWLHWDGAITELVGDNFDLPYDEDQELNPVVAVFKSFDLGIFYGNAIDKTINGLKPSWKEHIRESIESKMIEIEAEHIK